MVRLFTLIVITILFSSVYTAVSNGTKDDSHGFQRLLHTIKTRFKLAPNSSEIARNGSFSHQLFAKLVESDRSCSICKMLVSTVRYISDEDKLTKLIIKGCTMLKVETPKICSEVIPTFSYEFYTVLKNTALTPSEICGAMYGPNCATVVNPLHNWTIPLPPKTSPNPVKKFFKKLLNVYKIPRVTDMQTQPDTYKFLQITDTHMDMNYTINSIANCDEPMCCRKDSTKSSGEKLLAGIHGTVGICDIPIETFTRSLKMIAKQHTDEIDYIIWTGDMVPHDVWHQSKENQLDYIRYTVAQLNMLFPKTPIYPALGNHESYPVNSFPMPTATKYESIAWLYGALDTVWSTWIPEEARKTLRKCAYYAVDVKPNLRLISLNMNYCNILNWWLLLDSTDPCDQLSWMVSELQRIEQINIKEDKEIRVQIIGHIPPGTIDCLKVWSENYYRIVSRYSGIIAGQYFAHTHYNEFQLYFDYDQLISGKPEPEPVGVAYIAASLTTFNSVFPGYRIYTASASDHKLVNYENYQLNITELNTKGHNVEDSDFVFKMSSDALKTFALDSMEPSEWLRLVKRMTNDTKLFDLYKYQVRHNGAKITENCHQVCKRRTLCSLVSGKSYDITTCGIILGF